MRGAGDKLEVYPRSDDSGAVSAVEAAWPIVLGGLKIRGFGVFPDRMAGGAGGGILISEAGWLGGVARVFAAGCFGLKKSRMDAFLDIFDMANGRNCRSGGNFQFSILVMRCTVRTT